MLFHRSQILSFKVYTYIEKKIIHEQEIAVCHPRLVVHIAHMGAGKIDQNMVSKIREEALNKSRVMDIALHLTDLNGNRLANSPGYKKAAGYAVDF